MLMYADYISAFALARYRYGLKDSFIERMKEGIIKGFKQKVERKGKRGIKKGRAEGSWYLRSRQLETKFHDIRLPWLCSLTAEQIEQISSYVYCHTLEEIKN